MFYLDTGSDDRPGFHHLSSANNWVYWISGALPDEADDEVKRRLRSNLKHILVGLEMKAGLILPHCKRIWGRKVLFEPYCKIMIFEFCVGVFSICEGFGSIHYLVSRNDDGSAGTQVNYKKWSSTLKSTFDNDGEAGLGEKLEIVMSIRDKIHQDKLGARSDIDWHDFSYQGAFVPAMQALQIIFNQNPERIPQTTNLTEQLD
ncbi:MAG: hypothetical protein ABJM26_04870 [Anderseniella sp.]|uniref:hypothetical protein n=1 Tax=Marinobacter sp. TaxID=50741 RepID=UPI003284C631